MYINQKKHASLACLLCCTRLLLTPVVGTQSFAGAFLLIQKDTIAVKRGWQGVVGGVGRASSLTSSLLKRTKTSMHMMGHITFTSAYKPDLHQRTNLSDVLIQAPPRGCPILTASTFLDPCHRLAFSFEVLFPQHLRKHTCLVPHEL